MLNKQNNPQLELFSGEQNSGEQKRNIYNKSFLNLIWGYEKTILLIFTIIVTSIISFSLGVEKGKGIALSKFNSRVDVANISTAQLNQVSSKGILPNAKQENVEAIKPGYSLRNYTIQLASFQTKKYAQKEAELLRKKGYSPLILPKGSYIVLCVGNFSKKEAAQSLLSELKKYYQSCYVRRL